MNRILWLLFPWASGGVPAPVDADHDTFPVGADCDDTDVHVHPHAPERANGVDDDCNGAVDDDVWTGPIHPRRARGRTTPAAPPIAVWSFGAGGGAVAWDAGPNGLDGRIRGGVWTNGGLDLEGGWVLLDHPELERTTLAWVVRFRTRRGGTLVSRGSGGSGPLPDDADSYRIAVGPDLVAEVAGVVWRVAVDLRDAEWHEVELGITDRVQVVVDGALMVDADGVLPEYDGTPTLLGADIDAGRVVAPFHGELAEVRLEAE